MNPNFNIAINFVKKIRKKKGILEIILFGSVSRGEDKSDSDIDIAIIHDMKNIEDLKKDINKIVHDKIQVIYINIDNLHKEIEIVSALTGEGILLYGKPLKVELNKKELKPYHLIIYDLSQVESKKKMLLNRALHGSVSKSEYKGKTYSSETKGLTSHKGIEKLTRGVILAEPKNASMVKNTLIRFDAKFKEELIWK